MYYPKQAFEIFDMKEYLFMGLILKERISDNRLKQPISPDLWIK